MSEFSIPIVYSAFSRHKLIEQNLNFFIKHRCTNLVFLVDKSDQINVENLKTIRLLQKFKENFPCTLRINASAQGSYCTFIDYFTNNNLYEPYGIFVEDDVLLTDEFFKFHTIAASHVNLLKTKNYAIVVPFGFNCQAEQETLRLISCDAKHIVGNLWGAGYLKEFVNDFFNSKIYKTTSTYLDSSILEYLTMQNKKILFTTHNLIQYCGIKDSKDRRQLEQCLHSDYLFSNNLNFKNIDLTINDSLLDIFLTKYKFFRNNCIELP